eukprot:CAMPEP_0194306234 /NCGR_PEP_ID=MMETSP0171-20130528/3453_1 /TAXON_ID=218684 /ORGANISM="Corethron pennatum, Strain L29A3" /LENGTH=460 /DNA_ID=CAMNT_0039057973 /DNA_START=255 /DNA_END=1637 /DNA_ORIENTATION=-
MGTISLAMRRDDFKLGNQERQQYAVKSIVTSRIFNSSVKELKNEIKILKCLDHPNIVKAYEVFEESAENISIVMEHCSGGDLHERRPYSEHNAAIIVKKLLSAVAFLHSKKITHRDIKLENIMFESKKLNAEVKLIDFGLSKTYMGELKKDQHMQPHIMFDIAGQYYSMAPEVFEENYTNKVDIWAVGVVAFNLLAGRRPFYSENISDMVRKIQECDYSIEGKDWEGKSILSKDFISKLLVLDPKERPTAVSAATHPWFDASFSQDQQPDESALIRVKDELDAYKRYGTMKKVSMLAIAKISNTSEIEEMRKVFESSDIDNDGKLSFFEFKDAMMKFNYTEKELQNMFTMLDIDGDNTIEYSEFIAATLQMGTRLSEDRIFESFRLFDTDNSGKISKKELKRVLGKDYSNDLVSRMIKEMDQDGDGKISYEEFLGTIRKENRKKTSQAFEKAPSYRFVFS